MQGIMRLTATAAVLAATVAATGAIADGGGNNSGSIFRLETPTCR